MCWVSQSPVVLLTLNAQFLVAKQIFPPAVIKKPWPVLLPYTSVRDCLDFPELILDNMSEPVDLRYCKSPVSGQTTSDWKCSVEQTSLQPFFVKKQKMWTHFRYSIHTAHHLVMDALWFLYLHNIKDIKGDVAGLATAIPQFPPLFVILYHLQDTAAINV